MGQSQLFGADAWADNRTWVYTGQIFTGTSTTLSFAANNDDADWFKINGNVVLDDNTYYTTNTALVTGLTAGTWVDFEYRVGNGVGGAGPSGQNVGGAAGANGVNWNASTGVVFSYTDETDSNTGALSLDALAYDNGKPTETLGGGATLFRYQSGLGFQDDLRVTGSGTVTIDGGTALVTEPSLRFENAAAATLTVNDGTGLHKTLAFANGTTLATNTAPITVAGTSDVRLGKISDGSLTGVRLIAGGSGKLIIDNVDLANLNDLNGTTLEAGAGGKLVILGSNNISPIASLTTPLTISGAGGSIDIGSVGTGQTFNKSILANESGFLDHTTNSADTIGSATTSITAVAGKSLTIRNSANTLTVASTLSGNEIINNSTAPVEFTGNSSGLTTFTNVGGTAKFRGNAQLTNLNVTAGRLEMLGNLTSTNAPAISNGATLALKNPGNFGTLPNPLPVPSGNLEFVPGSIGSNTVALTGGMITLAPAVTGLNGLFYSGDDGGAQAAFGPAPDLGSANFTSYASYFATRDASPVPPNGNGPRNTALTSQGGVEVLSYNPGGGDGPMYQVYGDSDINNIVSRMQGYINIPASGNYTFSTRSDDGSVLFIDGQSVVNNNLYQGMTTRSGSSFLTPGLHSIDIGFYEGGGGNGLEVFWAGPGLNNQLLPNAVLFPDLTPTTFANPVNVQQDSTINIIAPSAVVTSLTVQPGKQLTTTGAKLAATTLTLNGAGTYTINTASGSVFTANDIASGGAAVNINKVGTGVFAIDDLDAATPLLSAASNITITEGALGILLGGASNPTGAASLTFAGGGVVLSSKNGADQSYAIPAFSGNGSLEARQIASGAAGTTATPINITLTGNLNVGAGQTVTLGTADNYKINVGGTATGSGTVAVNGGVVNATTGTALQGLNVAINANGGTANLNVNSNTVNIASLASDSISTANVTLGTGSGPVALNFSGTGSGRFVGNLATNGATALNVVKTGAGTQSLLAPLGSTAVTNVTGVTVSGGTMELSPAVLGANAVTLSGGTLQMIDYGLSLKVYESDPGASGAYGDTLNTLAGVQSHYAGLPAPALVTNTAANGNAGLNYNPGDAIPPFNVHGYTDIDTIEALLTGKMFITTAGNYKFSPRSDDGTTVFIDGLPVTLNNFPQGRDENTQAPRDGTVSLTPGYHDIALTFNEGTGGQSFSVEVTGPNGLRRIVSNSELFTTDVTAANVVNLTSSSGIDARGGKLTLGTLNWTAGSTLTSVNGTAAFGTTAFPGAGTYTIAGAGSFEPGTITSVGNAVVTINNSGTGSLILNNTTTAQLSGAGNTINANGGGRVVVVTDSAGASPNPLGGAKVVLNNGELLLSTKTAGDFGVEPALQIAGNAIISADNGGGGAVSGTTAAPIVASLNTQLNYLANTLTVRSGSNYNLKLGELVNGTGPLNVTGGNVIAAANVTSGPLNVSAGRFTTNAKLTASSATIGSSAALQIAGITNIADGTTVNAGGALEVNGATYTGGNITLNSGSLEAIGGESNLSGVVINGSTPSIVPNTLTARLYPNFTNPAGGFGTDQGLLNTLTAKPAFTTTLGAQALNFGPNSAGDGAIASFFGTTPANTGAFTMTFTGRFTAQESGLHAFKESIVDDNAAFWVDLNQNGLFELNGSAGSEKLATQGCCGPNADPTISVGSSASLAAGQSYRVALVLEDTGGGGSLAGRFSTPSLAEAFINPGAQTGFWSSEVGGGTLRVGDSAELTLGVANNINEALFTASNGTLRITNAAAHTTAIGLIRSSTAAGTNTVDLGANETLNTGLLVVNDGSTIRKTGGGTLVATNHGLASGSTLEVAGGQLVLNGTGAGTGSVLASGSGTAVINGGIAGSVAADLGGTIAGTGTVASLEIRTGGTVSPSGATAGTLTVGSLTTPGSLAMRDGGQMKIDINSATSFDRINLNGTLTLEGAIPLLLTLGYNPADNVDQFALILNDGDGTDPVQGVGLFSYNGAVLGNGATFVANGTGFTQQFQLRYDGGDGNDVTLFAIPEPSAAAILLSGMGMLLGLQRFRRRTA